MSDFSVGVYDSVSCNTVVMTLYHSVRRIRSHIFVLYDPTTKQPPIAGFQGGRYDRFPRPALHQPGVLGAVGRGQRGGGQIPRRVRRLQERTDRQEEGCWSQLIGLALVFLLLPFLLETKTDSDLSWGRIFACMMYVYLHVVVSWLTVRRGC